MKKSRKQWIFMAGLTGLLLLFIGIWIFRFFFDENKKSALHEAVNKMKSEEGNWKIPEDIPFQKDSAEMLFLQGLEKQGREEYEEAEEIFRRAASKRGKDPALPGYTYFFWNEAVYALTGLGDPGIVESTMEALTLYEPFKKETLWTTVLSIAYEPETRQKAAGLLEDYLQIHPDLSIEHWSAIKNSIAMIEYMEGNYSKSIREFYDVWIRLEKKTLNGRLEEELIFAKEYIANIYHLFEDYEGAIDLYQSLIDAGKEKESSGIYSHYINLATAYVKIGDLEQAKASIRELEQILPVLDERLKAEIEGSVLDVLANIAMEEGKLKKARKFLEEAVKLYEKSEEDIFYGGRYFIELTYCKLLIKERSYQEAVSRLEELYESGAAKQYSMEREIFENLDLAYERTGNMGKQIDILRKQLKSEIEQEANIKKEYLEFSKYYGDANRLQNTNVSMLEINILSFWVICLCLILYLVTASWVRKMKDKKREEANE